MWQVTGDKISSQTFVMFYNLLFLEDKSEIGQNFGTVCLFAGSFISKSLYISLLTLKIKAPSLKTTPSCSEVHIGKV